MKEQEKLMNVLQKIVQEAENYKIETTEQLLQELVAELSKGPFMTASD